MRNNSASAPSLRVCLRLLGRIFRSIPISRSETLSRDALSGGPIRIAGDGAPYRSYLYAADLAIWLWRLLVHGQSARPYNVGSSEAVTIRELAETVVHAVAPGMNIEIARKPDAAAPPGRYVPSVERAQAELGLLQLIPLDEQIRRMYEWNRIREPDNPTEPRA